MKALTAIKILKKWNILEKVKNAEKGKINEPKKLKEKCCEKVVQESLIKMGKYYYYKKYRNNIQREIFNFGILVYCFWNDLGIFINICVLF